MCVCLSLSVCLSVCMYCVGLELSDQRASSYSHFVLSLLFFGLRCPNLAFAGRVQGKSSEISDFFLLREMSGKLSKCLT